MKLLTHKSNSTTARTLRLLVSAFAILLAAAPAVLSAQSVQISGAALSKSGKDTRKLTANARASGAASSASGDVQFIHNSPAGLSRFRGTVNCLTNNSGVVQISGVVDKGETAGGAVLDGKSFAFTIQTSASPQSFSLPNFGDSGSLAACSGGQSQMVSVTELGFRTQ